MKLVDAAWRSTSCISASAFKQPLIELFISLALMLPAADIPLPRPVVLVLLPALLPLTPPPRLAAATTVAVAGLCSIHRMA